MGNNVRILLADDHKILVAGVKELLSERRDFEVIDMAHNGQEAVDKARLHKPDVMLLDIDMPIRNGVDCIEEIKSHSPKTKLIILTMHQERSVIEQCISLGANGFVAKNTDAEELAQGIYAVLEGVTFYSKDIKLILQNKGVEIKKVATRSALLQTLSKRELEVLRDIAAGYSNREIGERLFISHRTVDTHRNNIMGKLDIHNIAGLIRFALSNGLISE